jgi:hypothetical protein
VGRAAFKKGSIPGQWPCLRTPLRHCALPPFEPQMGSTCVAFVLLLLEERDLAGVGAFQPSLGFKDFHHAARLQSPIGGHPG